MKKLHKRLAALLLCTVLLLTCLPFHAQAATAIDLTQPCSLTILCESGGEPLRGVYFDLYQVASIDAYAAFTLVGDFQNYPVSLENLNAEGWQTLAQTLSAYAARDALSPLASGRTDAHGYLTFQNLTPGLYLVIGHSFRQNSSTCTCEPFLVSLPNLDAGNTWQYDVTCTPKFTQRDHSTPEDSTVERRVLKVWQGDVEALRPESITVQLLKDGTIYDTVTLSSENNWGYSWKNLPEYNKDGSKTVWQITELTPAGYTVQITQNGLTFVITNTYAPEIPEGDETTRTVVKIWDDQGSASSRPSSVTVTLYCNGTAYDTQVLNAANNWQFTWEDLPKYDAQGNEQTWTLQEAAATGYTASIRQNGLTFVLTNSLDHPKLPQTGLLWWPVPVLAAAGLGFLILGAVLGKRRRHE